MKRKWFYRALQVLLVAYVFILEPTDAIPILGWLDEATAIGFVVYLQKRIKELDNKSNKEEEVIDIS